VPAALLVTAGFAAIFIQADNTLSTVSLTYGGAFLALCLAGHMVIRRALPYADPYLFPRRGAREAWDRRDLQDQPDARTPAGAVGSWWARAVRRHDRGAARRPLPAAENYRYLIAIAGVGSLLLPRLPVMAAAERRLPRRPRRRPELPASEFGKIAIVVFLAPTCATTARSSSRPAGGSSGSRCRR